MGGGDDYRLAMVSNARERMHAAEDRVKELEEQVQTLQRERDGAVHLLECADTPLMRDVLAERDRLAEQLEAWEALSTRQDAFIRYLRPDLNASRARADQLVARFRELSNPASELQANSKERQTLGEASNPASEPEAIRPVQKRGGYQPNAAGPPPTKPPPKASNQEAGHK